MTPFVNNGFYTVGGKVFINKVEAILESEKTHKPVDFNFHDDSYGRFDWSKEPELTLEELYAVRARELRNTYDHLVLHFSGGTDSLNILETFIKNDILIDELFFRGPLGSAEKNENNISATNFYAECYFQSWPTAQWAKNTHYPNLIITGVDTIDYTFDYFKNPNWFETYKNSCFHGGNAWRCDWDELVPRYKSLADQGKKVVHILGLEKPILHMQDNQYYVRFLDKYRENHLGQRITNSELPLFVEPFYWAESTGPLVCKQAHTIKNVLKNNKLSLDNIQKNRDRGFHDWIASVIYNRTLPIRFKTNKPDWQRNEQDSFFFKDQHTEHFKNYKIGIEHFEKLIPEKWKHQHLLKPINSHTTLLDLLGVWSKSYCIGA